ncbi:hypothetical protein PAXINDRAFT_171683 [Paxillus involutus ATCC 200175]|uniref:Uncharacterized protein n=1 Tax=Paxillus involutus ATCC 200175 TaxID=664439 RepID=A0A0C9TWQ3_PAXIN|nr:hypothetical protein PAXINDRAFT_171683 [Paxillus involutus ATCC 200175]
MDPNGRSGWSSNSRGGYGRQMSMSDSDSDVDRDESAYTPTDYAENEIDSRSHRDQDRFGPRGGQINQVATVNTPQGSNSRGHNGTGVRTDSGPRGNERRSASTSNYPVVQQPKDINKKKK